MSSSKPYMIIFKQAAPQSAIDEEKERVQKAGGNVTKLFESSILRGFTATLPDSFAENLTTSSLDGKHQHIEYVEPDAEVHTMN